ncbi:PspC domain-containing protein [Nocardiopsis coralliicola]
MNENFGQKKLQRSREHRILTGVAGGIGQFFGVDANLVRVAFAVLALFGFSGVLIYIVAWVVMPEEGGQGSVLEHVVKNFQGKKSDY